MALSDMIWQKTEEAGFFDGVLNFALVFGAIVGAAGRLDFVPAVKITRKGGYIFVVDFQVSGGAN